MGEESDKYQVKKSEEQGFDIQTAFDEVYSKKENDQEELDYYFRSYSNPGIHSEMLQDSVRTLAYKDSIMRNPHLFKDKVVLDIGCGTGILSLFAADAGASHVYAIDYASIAENAKEIVKENSRDNITVMRGKVEEIELPVKEVDIIISEWMGYFLIYESMLDTVLFARDKWLKKGGLMFPDKAIMYMSAFEDEEFMDERVEFWNRVYGINMTPMKDCVLRDGCVEIVNREAINSNTQMIADIDLQTCKVEDLDFASEFNLKFSRKDLFSGYVIWWDCVFSHCHVPLTLSTSKYIMLI